MIQRVLSDTRVLVQSENIRRDVREFFSELNPDIGVLGNGVSIPDEQASLDSNIVLFMGRLAPKKGVVYLIEAMDDVDPQAELWVVGDGKMRSELEKLAEMCDVDVIFHGEVDPCKVNVFYQKAAVLALPSLEGEGMPNAVLEAMAHGVPVVTTRSGGLPELVKDHETGYLVPMRDTHSLSESIESILLESDHRKKMGKKSREYVCQNYAWDVLCQNIKSEYEKLTMNCDYTEQTYLKGKRTD